MSGNSDDAGRKRFGFDARLALVTYVRLLSAVFLLSGLSRWSLVLGVTAPGGDFLAMPTHRVVATIFFSVFDLVAAVGLWLLAPWGTVVWLISALTEVALNWLFSDVFGTDTGLVAFHVTTVVLYAILTFLYEKSRAA